MQQEGVVCGFGNRAVELHILAHAVAAALHRRIQRLHSRPDAPHVAAAAALCSQGGHLGLQGPAHLDHLDHGRLRGRMAGLELQWRKRGAGTHKHAAALARVHQAQRLQARDRLAHHGAADPELFDQPRLGGQLVARRQATAADFRGQLIGHLVGEAGTGGDRGEGRVHGVVIQKTGRA